MKVQIFVTFLNKRSKGLTMQIIFLHQIYQGVDIYGHDCMYIYIL